MTKKIEHKVDLNRYTEFVEAITSRESEDLTTFMNSLDRLDANYNDATETHGPNVNVSLLITGAMGMCGEAGEFSEIVKKLIFHSKPLTVEVHQHLQKELGDIIFYWTNTCRSLGIDPNTIIQMNVDKLSSRYPGGVFSVERSENRDAGDI
jgi:NTP pyrophosphatase (non-canonical NTP hydrolase)